MGFFSRRALYKFVSTFEIIFGILILAFSINLVIIVAKYNVEFEEKSRPFNESQSMNVTIETNKKIQPIKYSALVGIAESLIQIGAAVFLVLKSKVQNDLDGKRIARNYEFVPLLWLLINVLLFGVLVFMFVFPTLEFQMKNDNVERQFRVLTTWLKEYYTYTVCSGLFKILFIWIVYSTINNKCGTNNMSIDSPTYKSVDSSQNQQIILKT